MMRISTAQIFQSGIDAIQRNQGKLNHTQLQLSTGRRILQPSDDPSGAVQSLQFRTAVSQVEQYERNGLLAEQRLRYSESILGSVGEGLQRVRQLALQGNNASQDSETRRYIAREIREVLEQTIQLANTRDANGEYIFAGNRSQTEPFSKGADGAVQFSGSEQQRRLQISPVRHVQLGDSGAPLFMRIPEGNGTFAVVDGDANQGSGVVSSAQVLNREDWNAGGGEFRIEFSGDEENLRYQIRNMITDDVTDPEPYLSGSAITFAGVRVTIDNTPQEDDHFIVRNSEDQSLFATYQGLIDALERGSGTDASNARLNNAINRALLDMDQAQERILDIRASLGSRLQAVENQNQINADQVLQMRSTLSEIEDLDYAEAISRFSLQQTALQAAQQTYVQVQRLSLFNYL